MKKITLITLAVILITTMFSINVSAQELQPNPSQYIIADYSPILGSVDNEFSHTIVLTGVGDGFNPMTVSGNGIPVNNWFADGQLTGTMAAWAKTVGTHEIHIKITGVPQTATTTSLVLTVPVVWLKNYMASDGSGLHPSLVSNANVNLNTASPFNSTMNVLAGINWEIVETFPVQLNVTKDDAGKINGTLTATATVNNKTVTAATTSSNAAAAIYVTSGDEITFTAKPNSRYKVGQWTGINFDYNESRDKLTYTQSYTGSAGVSVDFTEIPTEYRILEVSIDGIVDYTVKQEVEDDKDVTNVYIKDTADKANDNVIEMKFGETAPVIIKKNDVNVRTDKKNVNNEYEVVAATADYNLTIASKNTAAVKAETVPAENTTAYSNIKAELRKYLESNSNIYVTFDENDIEQLKQGDLIITPQGAGTSAITITAKRTSDSNDPKLSDGKIEFNIQVEAAATIKDFESDSGILTATTMDIYGQQQTLILDIINETAESDTSIAGYSTSGSSWSSFTITAAKSADIAKIFDKSGKSLRFASALSGSKSAPGATIWDIGEIGARPKAPQLKVFYGNPSGVTDADTWTVTGFDYETANESVDASVSKLFFASSEDKKTADKNDVSGNTDPTVSADAKFGFILFGEDGKFPLVKDLSDNKVIKSTYLFRFSATWKKETISLEDGAEEETYIITPASKTVKLTVSSKLKPSRAKVDYKKGKVILASGAAYYYGENINNIDIADKTIINNVKNSIKDDAKVMTKLSTKSGILFGDINENTIGGKTLLNDDSSSNIIYWTAATGKKPQSAATIITVHNYQLWTAADTGRIVNAFISGSGKYKLPKGYEVLLENEEKWKTSISVKSLLFGENTIEVRRRGNAKFDVKNTATWLKSGTGTASESETFIITVGEYTNSKGKTKIGITEVKVSN